MAELGRGIAACRAGHTRAVLLTGTGGAFCAGADVRDFTAQLDEGGPEGLSEHLRTLADTLHQNVIAAIRRLDKPAAGRNPPRQHRSHSLRRPQGGPGMREMPAVTGVPAKYAKLVSSAAEGAVTR